MRIVSAHRKYRCMVEEIETSGIKNESVADNDSISQIRQGMLEIEVNEAL